MIEKNSISFIPNKKLMKHGPGTFIENFKKNLKEKKIKYFYGNDYNVVKKIFINSCTFTYFFWLIKQKFYGAEVIQRVDGKLWQYKFKKVGIYKTLYSIFFNLLVLLTMIFISNKIIFQSKFVKKLWNNKFIKKKKTFVIYNFCKKFEKRKIEDKSKVKLICVEGNIDDAFNSKEHLKLIKNYSVLIYGNVSKSTKLHLKKYKNLKFAGSFSRKNILKLYKTTEKLIYYSLEFNAACSNSTIEALSHSVPAIAFNSGSMNEIINSKNGILINYDIKKFRDEKYLNSLQIEKKISQIEKNYKFYSKNAFYTAKKKFNFKKNSSKYIQAIFN